MPKYVMLVNYTDERMRRGSRSQTDPERATQREDFAKSLGITSDEEYLTMGPYDRVAIIDAPNDEAMTKYALFLGGRGSVRTMTMRAYTREEEARILDGLP